MRLRARVAFATAVLLATAGCTRAGTVPAASAPSPSELPAPRAGDALGASRQLVLVTTARWDTTGGMLRRYERDAAGAPWRAVGAPVQVVVGRTGLAWGDASDMDAGAPVKHEGDGRAPAGRFPLDTVFGFAPAAEAAWVRMPYVALTPGSDCVDDTASVHYNTVVDRGAVPRVDWNSAEHMRQVDQYRLGVIVGYNAPPRAGRGSCIFLHIWGGPGTSTAGCTAMDEGMLRELVLWLDRAKAPVLVQLPESELARRRGAWALP